MVILASAKIRCVAGVAEAASDLTINLPITNPTAKNVGTQIVKLVPSSSITLNTTDDAFQILSDGQIAFKTDLPASETKQLNIARVLANQFEAVTPIEVTQDADTFTMSNEYYTVTLRKTQNLSSPLTPVASIVPATGTVSLTGSTHHAEWDSIFDPSGFIHPTLTGYTFEILEQGPLIVRAKMTYRFSHPTYMYGETLVFPANDNALASETVELRAGINGVFFENESNYNWVSGFDIENLDFNELKYRGHIATTLDLGYTPEYLDGAPVEGGGTQIYHACCDAASTPRLLATRDITAPIELHYIPFVPIWDQFIQDMGRIIIARNSGGTGQFVAAAGGGASRALGTGYSGIIFTGSGTSTKLEYYTHGRGPDGRLYSYFRYPWVLTIEDEPYDDTYGALTDANVIQNQHINSTLTKLSRWVPPNDTETFSASTLYLSPAQQADLFERIRTDPAYADSLIARDGYAADLINYIETPTPAAAKALYDEVVTKYEATLESHWFGHGIYELHAAYMTLSTAVDRFLPRIPVLMEGDDLSAEQKANLYKMMLFFGLLFADQDFAPLDEYEQFNFGTANQILQYNNQMDSIHLQLLNNAEIVEAFDVTGFPTRLAARIDGYISAYGSSKGTPHYTKPGTIPTLNLVQQGKVAGLIDFATTSIKLTLFANFILNWLTPADARFGGLRKFTSLGDGSLEGSEMPGQLGTIFAEANPTLSAKMMEAWDLLGSPHSSDHTSSIFKIDDTLTKTGFTLTDAHYPDYMSVFRSAYGTANESAVWFLHGDWYSDHRHYDTGATYCYLLGVPISLGFSSFYDPYAPGALMAGGLALASDVAWDGTGSTLPNLGLGSLLFSLSSVTPALTGDKPTVTAVFNLDGSTTWTRAVTLNREDVALPVVIIRDSFAGTNASVEKIISLNLMMEGAVVTPTGNVTPTVTMDTATTNAKTSIGTEWSTFEFTGQWGVNIILTVYNATAADYQLGAFKHDYSPSIEAEQYLAATGNAYSEMQYMFRLWSTDDSQFVLVSWRDGDTKPVVTTSGMDVLVNGRVVT